MGMQDRDYYKDWRKERDHAATAKVKTPKINTSIGPLPRWVIFLYSSFAAYGLVSLGRDLAKLL